MKTKTLQEQLDDQTEELKECWDRISQLEKTIEENETEIKNLEKDIEEKDSSISELEGKVEELEELQTDLSIPGIEAIPYQTRNLVDELLMETLAAAVEKSTPAQVTEHLKNFKPITRYSLHDLL